MRLILSRIATCLRAITAGAGTLACITFAGPALANSSSNADISAPLRAAQSASQSASGGEDEQFRELFSTWQSFEADTVPALAAVAEAQSQAGMSSGIRKSRPEVSIPSRVPLAGLKLTSGYGMRNHPVTGRRRSHKGIDLAAPTGTPIFATADGLISRASWFSSYGLYVSIEHGGQIQTRYAHMSRLNVANGQRVQKGDIIGFVGSTGRSTGPHLHYEVRIKGAAVDPVPYMHGRQIADASTASSLGRGGSK